MKIFGCVTKRYYTGKNVLKVDRENGCFTVENEIIDFEEVSKPLNYIISTGDVYFKSDEKPYVSFVLPVDELYKFHFRIVTETPETEGEKDGETE